jgi:abortive infection bacteriophage resistance protein
MHTLAGFRFFSLLPSPMKYEKPAISIAEQIALLKQRGLIVTNPQKTAHYLSNISFYRFRAYTFPFQDNSNPEHPFVENVSFEDIVQLYVFDRQLRLLIFNAIEKIEIALRTQIIYHYALQYGSHWHLNPTLYNNAVYFAEHIASLGKEIDRSKETFIDHYKKKYTQPKEPPCWMSLEVTSIGLLSKLFENLKRDKCKNEIAAHFGLKNVVILENWMRCFSILRNICAHHGRVWNRRITPITIAQKPVFTYIYNKTVWPYKIYAYLVNIQYILNTISPNHHFKQNLLDLMKTCPMAQEKEMGFPQHWQKEDFWK